LIQINVTFARDVSLWPFQPVFCPTQLGLLSRRMESRSSLIRQRIGCRSQATAAPQMVLPDRQ
jgi:hypothetical protein